MMSLTLAAALLLGAGIAPDTVPLYDDLGDHHYEITTASPLAQEYFDQGLRLYYAFNHQEAVRSFRAAQLLDPSCGMCWWGEALAFGPNINLPMDSASGVAAWAAAREARARRAHVGEKERALIDALALRYSEVPGPDRAALDSAWARALAGLSERWPEDVEIAVLMGEAQMDLRPWDYWRDDADPHPGIGRALASFERVMERNPDHPGACHFFIHAVEKLYPERAVPCAERLAGLMPGAGHIVHMPGHIYIRVGRYRDAIRLNEHAAHADETYIRDQRPPDGVYTAGYYPHNYDFLAFAASMIGEEEKAIMAADMLASLIPEEMMLEPGMTFLQHFATRPLQMRIRFGLWEEILGTPAPAAEHPHALGMWHYARGRAFAATGRLAEAQRQLEVLGILRETMRGVRLEFNDAGQVLGIGAAVLAGRVAQARGEVDEAVAHLREAVRLEDELLYGEPPEWTIPVRQELGALLLEAGRAEEAAAVFREDLDRFPANSWSEEGLRNALDAADTRADMGHWRAITAEDLAFVHRILAEHHPGPLDTANAWFAEWHERGYHESVALLDSVQSYGGYRAVLQRYVAGFRDGHLNVSLSLDYRWTGWPGFAVTWRNGAFVVRNADPDLEAPAAGDRLVSCDGTRAQELYRERVRPFAGQDIPADRYRYTPDLLVDRVNPLLPGLSECVFDRDGERMTVALRWSWLTPAQLDGRSSTASGETGRFEQWETGGGDGLWVRLPTFAPRGEELDAAQEIFAGLSAQRGREFIVLDVRGNGGGSSFWAGELVRQLYGEAWWAGLEAELDSGAYPTHRISPENVAHFRALLPQIADQAGQESYFYRTFDALAGSMAAALVDGLEMMDFRGIEDPTEAEQTAAGDGSPAEARPLYEGRIVLVTDAVCASACLGFADVVRALPNALHVGQPTGADTNYMEVRGLSLPSRNGRLNFATKVYRNRSRGHNEWHEPEHLWTDDIDDTPALQTWVMGLMRSGG